MTVSAVTKKDIARFWGKVQKGEPDTCWYWTAGCFDSGYGVFQLNGKAERAHCVAWFVAYGSAEGLCVLHRCDNPPCVNPAHLFLGTNLDNIADRHAKGRTARGDQTGSRKCPESRPRGDSHHSRTKPECLARGDRNGSRLHPERLNRGEKVNTAKLNARAVLEIRTAYASGVATADLAVQFGVKRQAILRVIHRETWSHI